MTWRRYVVPITLSAIAAMVTWFIISRKRNRRQDVEDSSASESSESQSADDDSDVSISENLQEVIEKSIKISVADSEVQTEKAIELMKSAMEISGVKVIGLDCEWVAHNGHANAVSLLQLSSLEHCCLIRLHKIKETMPENLQDLLQDRSILKVGVGVMEDCRKLHRDYGFTVRGCIDLRTFAYRHRPVLRTTTTGSLADLSDAILSQKLDKSAQVRCGDWESEELSQRQVWYAAEDAISALKIFLVLALEKLNSSVDELSEDRNWIRAMSLCQGIVDEKFKQRGGPRHGGKVSGKTKSKKFQANANCKAYSARKEPLYHNCQLEAPDGQQLCTCDRKKAEWYVAKGIGEVVTEEPLVVRLKFEPSGRPGSERNYYLKEKENQCVVCGAKESYIRKNVVPHEYRKYFPTHLKEHSSHDVVLLCFTCHQKSSNYDSVMRKKMADRYDAPLPNHEHSRFYDDTTKVKVRSAARALKYNKHKLPEERVYELERTVRDFLGVDVLTDGQIEECVTLDAKISNDDYVSHGEKVIGLVSRREGGLIEFEKEWRRHFLNTMEPQFLPELWSVDHRDSDAEEYNKRRRVPEEAPNKTRVLESEGRDESPAKIPNGRLPQS